MTKLPRLSCALAGATLTVLGATAPAMAAECKTIASVQASAAVSANTAAGGHLTGHIEGATPPPGWNYTNKSLFTSASEYTGAWKNYLALKQDNPLNCTNTVQGNAEAVSVEKLLKRPVIGAIRCNDATCTARNKTQFPKIEFGFIYANNQWILNTAYPSQ